MKHFSSNMTNTRKKVVSAYYETDRSKLSSEYMSGIFLHLEDGTIVNVSGTDMVADTLTSPTPEPVEKEEKMVRFCGTPEIKFSEKGYYIGYYVEFPIDEVEKALQIARSK